MNDIRCQRCGCVKAEHTGGLACPTVEHGIWTRRKVDKQAAAQWRQRHTSATERVRAELAQKFPVLTAENVAEALTFQTTRIAELMLAKDE
jgi:uncharacterized Zn finger protein (UPF0148 family)